jgi:hypothetical protein
MTPADIDRVFGRGRLRMITGSHVEVFREQTLPGERRRYTKRFLATEAGDFRHWTEREWRILARLVGHGIGPVPDVVQYDRGVGSDQVPRVQTYDAGITIDHWATLLPVRRGGQLLGHVFQDCAHWWALARHSLIALDAIHEIGLVHLDLKADNVCIPYEPAAFDPAARAAWIAPRIEQISLIDFAFSLVSGEQLTRALPIARQGEFDYQSPRLLDALAAGHRGDLGPTRKLDWRCDLFSLAAMLRRYLPDPESAPENGWTPELDARARALVRRLLQAHDAELTALRPHAELFTLASAPLADPQLAASLQSGWWLAPGGADLPAQSPTPVTRIALPVAAVQALAEPTSAVQEAQAESPPPMVADVREWPVVPPTARSRVAWPWIAAAAAVAAFAVPFVVDGGRRDRSDTEAVAQASPQPVAQAPSVTAVEMTDSKATVPAATTAPEAAAASAAESSEARSEGGDRPDRDAPMPSMPSPPAIDGDGTDGTGNTPASDRAPVVEPIDQPVPAAPPAARARAARKPATTPPRREAAAKKTPAARPVKQAAAGPAARASRTAKRGTADTAVAKPAPGAGARAPAVLVRAPVTLPPAPVTLPPAPVTLPPAPVTLPPAPVTLPPATATATVPSVRTAALPLPAAAPLPAPAPVPVRDHATRADELLAAELPRIAQRAERRVQPVLSAVAAGAPVGEVRSAARTLRLGPGDPQLGAGSSATDARALNEAARQALWRRGSLTEAVELQTQAFGANPLDAEIAGNLAQLRLRQRPHQAELARQIVLHALTLPDPRHPHGRIEDWTTLAIASALAGREREARHAWWVSLELANPPQRQCRVAMNAYVQYGERLRASVDALLHRARELGLDADAPQCEEPVQWRGRYSGWR